MLVPVQTSGTKPPLFFVHGVQGVMVLGSAFASALGPDQPFYIINADGMDGRRPAIDNVQDMVLTYVEEIENARRSGPLRIAGMCSGCLIAIELARSLQQKGRQTGAVILADPPAVPYGFDKSVQAIDPRQPHVAQQLYEQVRRTFLDYASRPYHDMPFDPGDPQQTHAAILAGVAALVAIAKYIPTPFPGSAELIVSAGRAPGFFHPQMPWHKFLPGPRVVHVLPWNHIELFREGRAAVARLLKFILDEPAAFECLAERRAERSVA